MYSLQASAHLQLLPASVIQAYGSRNMLRDSALSASGQRCCFNRSPPPKQSLWPHMTTLGSASAQPTKAGARRLFRRAVPGAVFCPEPAARDNYSNFLVAPLRRS